MDNFFLPSKSQVSKLRKWRVSTFYSVLIGYIGYYLCRVNISAALPFLNKEFNFTNTQLGLILTVSEASYALGKFINGPLADKIGGKKVFIIGMLGAILFNLLFAFSKSLLSFIIFWSFCRYFLSMGWGGILKIIGSWYEKERIGTIMGLVSINFQAGGALALIFCGYILSLGYDWKFLFFLPSSTLFIICILSIIFCKDSPQKIFPKVLFGENTTSKKNNDSSKANETKKQTKFLAIKLLFKEPLFFHLMIFSFITTFLRSVFVLWTAKFFVDIGISNVSAVFKSSIFPFLGVIGTIFLGWYTDKFSKNGNRAEAMWVMLSGVVMSLLAVAILVPYQLEYQNWIIFFIGLSGFCLYGPYSMTTGCLSLDLAGSENVGSCAGILDGIGYIGGTLAVFIVGYFSEVLGWRDVFYSLSFFAFIAVLSCFNMSLYFKNKTQNYKQINQKGFM